MTGYAAELCLAWCVLLNALVFTAAYRFSIRRMTRDRTQAALDSALLAYAVQYTSVTLPGLVGALSATSMTAAAMILSALLWAMSLGGPQTKSLPTAVPAESRVTRWIALATALFAVGYTLAFVYSQQVLPVMSNDAMTYHFPAAVQWLQTGSIGLFQTWFFNPANTYSPLGESAFVAWLLAPFGNDVLARLVAVPALLFTGLALFQLCRCLGVASALAALVAAAGILSRPFFSQSLMAKDDLFVTAFFLCALISFSPQRASERWGAPRLGLSVGLLLAMKYTALLTLPMLLLAIDGPLHIEPKVSRWNRKHWLVAAVVAAIVAGPWYLRNLWLTQNPLFPIEVSAFGWKILPGLFTPARSDALATWTKLRQVLAGGNYGLPPLLAVTLLIGWIVAIFVMFRRTARGPLLRAVLLGAILGIILFAWKSPFPEVRFVFPSFALLLAATAIAIEELSRRLPRPPIPGMMAAGLLLATSISTQFVPGIERSTKDFLTAGAILSALGLRLAWSTRNRSARQRWLWIGGPVAILAILCSFVNWKAYADNYRDSLFEETSAWRIVYGDEAELWRFTNQQLPPGASLAYANVYMVYPLQGFSLDHPVIYAPARPGLHTLADLPRLGDSLSGEQFLQASIRATVAAADESTWIRNLKTTGANLLLIGKGGLLQDPPEAEFARHDRRRFRKLFENTLGIVYAIDWGNPSE